jgi:lipopolysaccharide export system protein LptA
MMIPSKRMIVKDSVVIVRGELSARSGLVNFYRQDGKIDLFEKPIVWYQENQVTGDTIYLVLEKNRLKTATIKTRAFVLSQSDSAYPNGTIN